MTEGDDRLVDRDAFAQSSGESPRALPDPGGLFATLQRVIDATRAVFQVDGASLALEHEDGSLRWVVVTEWRTSCHSPAASSAETTSRPSRSSSSDPDALPC
jgi:hypothetical protein